MRTVIEEPDHFGHDPFNSFNRNLVQRWINIRDLDGVFAKHGKADEKGKVVLNLTRLGYDKLLGGGKINAGICNQGSKDIRDMPRAKVEAAGGEVLTDEQTQRRVRALSGGLSRPHLFMSPKSQSQKERFH